MLSHYPWFDTVNRWREAIRSGDAQVLADLIFYEFDLEISDPERTLALCCERFQGIETSWSEGTWRMGVKLIITDMNLAEMPSYEDDWERPHVSAVFHFGFVFIPETEEHQAMNEDRASPINGWTYPEGVWPALDKRVFPTRDTVARSKICRTNRIISPIDRVAKRVVPET